jgi:hypothetical protein
MKTTADINTAPILRTITRFSPSIHGAVPWRDPSCQQRDAGAGAPLIAERNRHGTVRVRWHHVIASPLAALRS